MYSNLYDPAPHSYLYGSGWPSDPPEELSLVNEPSPPTGEDYGRPQYTTVDFDPAEGNYPPDIQTHPVLNYDLTQTQVSTQHLLSQEQTQQGPIPYQPQFPYQDLPNNVLNEHPTTNFPQHPPNASYASSPLTNLDPFQEILAEALGQPPKDPTEGPMNPYHRCDYCGKCFKGRKWNRDAHVKEVHLQIRPYQCPYCPHQPYKRKADLNTHIKNKHKYLDSDH